MCSFLKVLLNFIIRDSHLAKSVTRLIRLCTCIYCKIISLSRDTDQERVYKIKICNTYIYHVSISFSINFTDIIIKNFSLYT